MEYLHYGLFKDKDISLPAAQEYSTELLIRHMPPPCKVLEVGIGLGTTAERLAQLGYEVTGITPDGAQLALARQRVGESIKLLQTRFEDLHAPP